MDMIYIVKIYRRPGQLRPQGPDSHVTRRDQNGPVIHSVRPVLRRGQEILWGLTSHGIEGCHY